MYQGELPLWRWKWQVCSLARRSQLFVPEGSQAVPALRDVDAIVVLGLQMNLHRHSFHMREQFEPYFSHQTESLKEPVG